VLISFPDPANSNASLRDNIIFGDLEPNEERLQAAIKACALEPDLEIRKLFLFSTRLPGLIFHSTALHSRTWTPD
jgi:hypothetical protein